MMTFALIILAFCAVGIVACLYMSARNEWVYRRRRELIAAHYAGKVKPIRGTFDDNYGRYYSWLYDRPFCWDPAKLAGIERWVK